MFAERIERKFFKDIAPKGIHYIKPVNDRDAQGLVAIVYDQMRRPKIAGSMSSRRTRMWRQCADGYWTKQTWDVRCQTSSSKPNDHRKSRRTVRSQPGREFGRHSRQCRD
jgi:hypothetical protein